MLDNLIARSRDDEGCLPELLHHCYNHHVGKSSTLWGGGFSWLLNFCIYRHRHERLLALSSCGSFLLEWLRDRDYRVAHLI
jgi:hypothetical protein